MIFYLFKKCTFLDLSFWARCSKRNCIHLPTFWTTRILNKIDETVFLDFVQQEAWYCDPWEKRSKWDEPSGASVYPQEVGSRLHAEQGTQRGTEDTLNWEYCSSPERPRHLGAGESTRSKKHNGIKVEETWIKLPQGI